MVMIQNLSEVANDILGSGFRITSGVAIDVLEAIFFIESGVASEN
jgi:hypothetical protein